MERAIFTKSFIRCCAMQALAGIFLLMGTGAQAQTISTFAGNALPIYSGDGGPATSASISFPSAVISDDSGNIYICDFLNSAIRKVDASGNITTVAGTGSSGYSGDGGPATAAQLNLPVGIALNGGNLYIADAFNNVVRKVDDTGGISTVAGNGTSGYAGDSSDALSAELTGPYGVAFDAAGNMYIADEGNSVIRKVDAVTNIITTVAGVGGPGGYSGDGGPATSAQLFDPYNVAFDATGNMYIVDYYNNRIRKVDAGGIITTVVGNGTGGYGGDDSLAVNAKIYTPTNILFDAHGDMYISDQGNSRVRKVNTFGIITTVAGNGVEGYTGDGGDALDAEMDATAGIAFDTAGNLYIADQFNSVIRKVDAIPCTPVTAGTISSDAGSAICDSGSTTLTVTGGSTGTGVSYQWQSSVDGISWTNAIADTAFITPVATATTYYRAIYFCSTYGSMDTTVTDTVIINPPVIVTNTISADPGTDVTAGTSVTFTATITGGGDAPTYQWQKNGMNISGATDAMYTSSTLANNDSITCIVHSSVICASADSVISPALIMHITTGISNVNKNGGLTLSPNPNNGLFHLTGGVQNGESAHIEILNSVGQLVYNSNVASENGRLDTQISMPGESATGIYMLKVTTGNDITTMSFAVEK